MGKLQVCVRMLAFAVFATANPAHALQDQSSASSIFDPRQFFAGRTEGVGKLKVLFRRHRQVRVHGIGHVGLSGELILDQDVDQEGKPRKHRVWRMQPLGEGQYTATLSEAVGPVTASVKGRTMRLNFTAKGHLRVRQDITLAVDGRSAENKLVIRKMGIVVARLNEHIVHRD